jgi:glycosyltransferase involved in cell wall biosynthesis
MTTLVIVNKPITTLSDGHDLRVWHLCRALAEFETLISVCVSLGENGNAQANEKPLRTDDIFLDEIIATNRSPELPSWRRHLRWSEVNLYRMGYPEFYREIVSTIEKACLQYSIQRLIVFGSHLAEFSLPFREKKILFDVCDSVVLTHERAMRYHCKGWSAENVRRWVALQRWKQTERQLPHWFSHVTTISNADSEAIIELAGHRGKVSTVPNGVTLSAPADTSCRRLARRGVAFWGNLGFEPNREALRYFLNEVYFPYLRKFNIECVIVGRGAEPWLANLAKTDRNIHVEGFVQDLRSAIGEYPVMVNPMVIGSGMKNKVLEAFSMGMGVVSTSLGMEAISGAMKDEHYLEANTAEMFALSIRQLLDNTEQCAKIGERARSLVSQRYSWSAVSSKWVMIFKELGEDSCENRI